MQSRHTAAERALREAAAIRPDVIVADVRLGSGLDGLELCERLKQDPATKDIPVILITAWLGDKHLQRRAEAAGCALVLIKPVDPSAIVGEVRRFVR